MEEVAVYEVAGGKIVYETFFLRHVGDRSVLG
jgi:hypothetical protein